MNSKPPLTSLSALICLLFLCPAAFAHHVVFCKAVIDAVEKPDVASVKELFEEGAWEATEDGMSAAALQERLKQGKVILLQKSWGKKKSSDQKFEAHSSYDKFDSRLRCVLTFRIEHDGETEQVFVLAKRVGDDGATNPKAWRIWRIVADRTKAEYFLGRKIPIKK
jgi:hypothetical protein